MNASEKPEFPVCIRKSLVQRRISDLCSTDAPERLVRVINPFAVCDGEFDPLSPTVGTIDPRFKVRCPVFTQTVFRDCLSAWISQGSLLSTKLVNLVVVIIETFEAEDIVEMDASTAKFHSDTLAICKAMFTIATDSLDADRDAMANRMFNIEFASFVSSLRVLFGAPSVTHNHRVCLFGLKHAQCLVSG